MDKLHICGYVGLTLRKHGYVTAENIQKYIKNDPSSGVTIPTKEISEVLEFLTWCDFLESMDGNIYKRFITDLEKCKLQRQKLVQ